MQISNRIRRLEKLIPPPPEKPLWEIEWERQTACDHPGGWFKITAVAIEGRPGNWTHGNCSKCGYDSHLLDTSNLLPTNWVGPGTIGGDWEELMQKGYLDYVPFSIEVKNYYEQHGAFSGGKSNTYHELMEISESNRPCD